MDDKKVRKAVDQVYKAVTPATVGILGHMGPPGTCQVTANRELSDIFWRHIMKEDNRLLVESISGIQQCLEYLKRELVERTKNLPSGKIKATVHTPIGSHEEELEVKLIPVLRDSDWQPILIDSGFGFQIHTIDDKYEVDGYPVSPAAYPRDWPGE